MLLAIEVGNTNTSLGLFTADGVLASSYRLSTERERMPDEWFALIAALFASDGHALAEVDGVIVSSVVPSVTTWLLAMVRERLACEPVVITGDLDVGLALDVDVPRQLGADRIRRGANLAASAERSGRERALPAARDQRSTSGGLRCLE